MSQQICEKLPSITVTSSGGMSRTAPIFSRALGRGVARTNYRHPLPEHVYDVHMQYWGNIDLII
ncbi:MAG: hypothetical protein WCB79_10345 [Halobacteriota archaeon]